MATLQRRNDKWRVLIRRKGHKAVSRTFRTKREAERFGRETETRMDREAWADPTLLNDTTLAQVIESMRMAQGLTKSQRSAAAVLTPTMGHLALSGITVPTIIRHVNHRIKQHKVSTSTVRHDLVALTSFLKFARLYLNLPINMAVLQDAKAMLRDSGKVTASRQRSRRPTDEELFRLYLHWDSYLISRHGGTPMADVVQFAIESCMRLGEICRITWDDLDRGDKTIWIRDRKDPKAKLGNDQRVPLLGKAFELVERQPQGERIFPYKPTAISQNFARTCKTLDIEDLHFHDLRHHGISGLFERGYQIQEVALVSGHKTWAMLARYTQLKPEDLHR